MLQKINSATRHRIVPQIRAAVAGVGVFLTSAPLSMGSDGAYRSLSSGDVTYVEPVTLGASMNFSDRTSSPPATVSMADGFYGASPYVPNGSPVSMPTPMGGNMEYETTEPMQFNVGTPVIHQSTPTYAPTPSYSSSPTYTSGYGAAAACRSYYGQYDAIWFKRAGDVGYSMSQSTRFEEFDYEFAGRYTIGQMFDCVDGVEASFTGPLRWQQQVGPTTAGLNSFLAPSGGYTAADVNTFNNAIHSQAWRATFSNYEFNRRWWAGDIMSSYIGVRGMDYKEQFAFDSTNGIGSGVYRRNVENFLIGAHIGGDMLYPLSQRLSIGAKARVGVFANLNEGQTLLVNNGSTKVNTFDKDTDLSGIIESGSVAKYRILPNVVVSAGYEMWYLMGVATVPQQGVQSIFPAAGTRVSASDQVLFHGGTAGLEISF